MTLFLINGNFQKPQKIRERNTPKRIAKIPSTRLPKAYKKKERYSPLLSKDLFSKAKVENVVNPPQNPVARKRSRLLDIWSSLTAYPITIPRIKLPTMFTLKVAGIDVNWPNCISLYIEYRKILPRPPPKNTRKNPFIIFEYRWVSL